MCFDDECAGKRLDRREFVTEGATALAALGGLAGSVQAQGKPPTRVLDDPTIHHGPVTFTHNEKPTIDGYLARPKAEGRYPAVLVVAGNVITEEYIPNTCAALALAGFVGLAPNIFHYIPPGTPNTREAYAKLGAHGDQDRLDDIQVGLSYLRSQPFVAPETTGILGFCSGGRAALLFAARSREIDAVVAFHPAATTESEIARVVVPVQIHHGTGDHVVDYTKSQELVRMLNARKTPVEAFYYDGADHGFLAYTRHPEYDPKAAVLAWNRSREFLRRHLKAG